MVLKLESELKSGKRARHPHLAARIVSTACYFICCFSGHLVLVSRIAQLRAGGKIKLCPLKIFISLGSDRVLRVGEVTAISFYSLPRLWAYSWPLGWLAAAAQGRWLALPRAWCLHFASRCLLHRCVHHLSSSFTAIPRIFQTRVLLHPSSLGLLQQRWLLKTLTVSWAPSTPGLHGALWD